MSIVFAIILGLSLIGCNQGSSGGGTNAPIIPPFVRDEEPEEESPYNSPVGDWRFTGGTCNGVAFRYSGLIHRLTISRTWASSILDGFAANGHIVAVEENFMTYTQNENAITFIPSDQSEDINCITTDNKTFTYTFIHNETPYTRTLTCPDHFPLVGDYLKKFTVRETTLSVNAIDNDFGLCTWNFTKED